MIRIVIADDHALFRAGLSKLFDAQPDLEVVGEAGSGQQALRRVAELSPDVLVLDLAMPAGNGFDVLSALKREHPSTRVVVVTGHGDEHHRHQALKGGAYTVVKKAVSVSELLDTMREVAAPDARPEPIPEPPKPELSRRELQVLVPLALGKNHREIAVELGITVKTVDTHRRNVLDKLELRNNAELTRYAVRSGLVEP
ncbi:MAG: response regulator transcription factor [Deltaproteobacteria bacterium]|jgi:DNA-binding NarL/FixJ family response regulator|nr:response regulator transcription factor [Deltaproteobacteria bacterium]